MDNAVLLLSESPLDYVSYGVFAVAVNYLRSLVAFLSTAVTFWKITADHPPQPLKEAASEAVSVSVCPEMGETETDDGLVAVTRGKFSKFVMTYCHEEADVGEIEDESETTSTWSWERMRKGEVEWYKCQDLGMLNGAVVRLWDSSNS